MADVTQYTLPLRELIELIIKNSDVHDGIWSLAVGMQVTTGSFGPSPDQSFPGAALAVNQIGIQRMDPSAPINPGSIVVDAAKVNPRPKKGKGR